MSFLKNADSQDLTNYFTTTIQGLDLNEKIVYSIETEIFWKVQDQSIEMESYLNYLKLKIQKINFIKSLSIEGSKKMSGEALSNREQFHDLCDKSLIKTKDELGFLEGKRRDSLLFPQRICFRVKK